jgi:diguanylate cyclase (GGDEF)-like protein
MPSATCAPTKVLVADDSSLVRRMLGQLLSGWGYEAVACRDGAEAWKALQEKDAPVLTILDWEMPGMSGIELCRKIRQAAAEPYVYVILLTANEQKEAVVEGLTAGADDYLRKPFNQQELEARLRAGRRITDLQAELVAAREAQRAIATHDALTGLWNRGAIFDLFRKEHDRARREGRPLSVVMVDLDHFKKVNDTYGHPVGDGVLLEAARRLVSGTRTYDAIGRYGGEEFLVLLPGCAGDAAVGRADQLLHALASRPMVVDGHELSLTASLGVAVIGPGVGVDSEELLRAADEALYRAKTEGRNRVCRA